MSNELMSSSELAASINWDIQTGRDIAEKLRPEFEREVGNRDSYGLKRSRRGAYVNPAIAREWKWFQIGAFYERRRVFIEAQIKKECAA